MGAITFSCDSHLIAALKRQLSIPVFVETGTFKGDTAVMVSKYFSQLFTIELSRDLFDAACERLHYLSHVQPLHGSSPEVLGRLIPHLHDQSVVYWLDAHWCGGATAGESNECPVLEELEAISALNPQSVILIDDARLFVAPPPAPHVAASWPRIDAITDALQRLSDCHGLWIINDVIIFAPLAIANDIIMYGRDYGIDLYGVYVTANTSYPQLLERQKILEAELTISRSPADESTLALAASMAHSFAGLNGSVGLSERPERLFVTHLQRLGLARVLDIGSNTGQFVSKLRRLGFTGIVYSVEPQVQCYSDLLANARQDFRWIVLPRQGVGAQREMLVLNISENSYSSSLLPVHSNHLVAEPSTQVVSRESVFVNRTADLMNPELMGLIDAVKIDVQGFEREVLQGLVPHLDHIQLLQVELSMVECYVGAPTLFELDAWICGELGFERISLEPSYYDETQQVVQQYDGLYRRKQKTAPQSLPPVIELEAIVTSAAGASQRISAAGDDVGGEWFQLCLQSWAKVAPKAISIAETPPSSPQIQWQSTKERPSISELFQKLDFLTCKHVLLANADILFADSFTEFLSEADPGVVYFGARTDVEQVEAGRFEMKGLYGWGFDYFLLPPGFIQIVNRDSAFPSLFRIGEPWWDYLLPILALAKGYPTKKLEAPHALHHVHPTQYSEECWIRSGEQFLDCITQLSAQGASHIAGLLGELLSVKDLPEQVERLHHLSRLVTTIVP